MITITILSLLALTYQLWDRRLKIISIVRNWRSTNISALTWDTHIHVYLVTLASLYIALQITIYKPITFHFAALCNSFIAYWILTMYYTIHYLSKKLASTSRTCPFCKNEAIVSKISLCYSIHLLSVLVCALAFGIRLQIKFGYVISIQTLLLHIVVISIVLTLQYKPNIKLRKIKSKCKKCQNISIESYTSLDQIKF